MGPEDGGRLPVKFRSWVSHDSPRAQTCTFEGPGLQSHHQNSTKRPPREEERMKTVAGEGKKKREIWGGPVEEEWGEGVRRRGSQGERPNLGRTHENFEHTPHRHNTPHHTTPQHNTTQHNTTQQHRVVLGKGGPSQGGPWPKKQDMSNKLSRRAAPLAEFFWGQGWFAKVSAQNGLIKKREAKSGAGQKWSEKTQKKHGETSKNISPSPKSENKRKETKNREKKHQNQKKNGEKNLSLSPVPDQKKKEQQNQKIENNAKRKKTKSKHCSNKKKRKIKKKKKKNHAF